MHLTRHRGLEGKSQSHQPALRKSSSQSALQGCHPLCLQEPCGWRTRTRVYLAGAQLAFLHLL